MDYAACTTPAILDGGRPSNLKAAHYLTNTLENSGMSPALPGTTPALYRSGIRPRHVGLRVDVIATVTFSLGLLGFGLQAHAQSESARTPPQSQAISRLLTAYRDHIKDISEGEIHFRDGTAMAFNDGQAPKSHAAWLAHPDVEDMLAQPYRPGPVTSPPGIDDEPGRARNAAFFAKIYGDCRTGDVSKKLVDVVWLPSRSGVKLKVTSVNGVARRLRAVSRALDRLAPRFDIYLVPPAGTYNCRQIAGTQRLSAHGYGIAIDIATSKADYWRWSKPGPGGQPRWRNRIPNEIVAIFEAHGFIWGGKWGHYDTMHFEFRPELLPPRAPLE